MVQAPVKTVNVEPDSGLSKVLMAGNRRLDGTRNEKVANQDGKTFAEALKNAAGGKSQAEKVEIRIRNNKSEKTLLSSDDAGKLKAGRAAQKKAPRQQDAEKHPRNTGSETHLTSASSAGRPSNVLAAVQNTVSMVPDNQESKVESGKRGSGSQNLKGLHSDPGKAGSAHWKGANPSDGSIGLSSSARRVEVIDSKRTGQDSKSDFRDRMTARKESVRLESGANRAQAADPGKGDSRFAVVETEIGIPGRSSGSGDSRSAAAELSRRLDAQAGNEIVRQVKVVLTRADAGEIRINLRPENLGRVRVEIHLEDNRLTGRIFVESAAAREAFRNSLDGLQTRLVESGFGAADLELAWDGNSGSFAGFGDSAPHNGKDLHLAVREFENMTGSVIRDASADRLVNMVV